MAQGYVVLVLHAHLPYVLSHGKWPHGVDWLCEAACETYIPLLNALERLSREGRQANFTIGITPVLCEMLASPLFRDELKAYVLEKTEAAKVDAAIFEVEGLHSLSRLAAKWQEFYEARLRDFTDTYDEDLTGAFSRFQETGQIELIASAATHAYLPLLDRDTSISAQIAQGVAAYRRHFRRDPRGIWLPECAYRPGQGPSHNPGRGAAGPRKGIEAFLCAHNLDYFFVDGHHVLKKEQSRGAGYGQDVGRELSMKKPRAPQAGYGERFLPPEIHAIGDGVDETVNEEMGAEERKALFAVHKTGSAASGECAFFARDTETSLQVWSAQWGYPGDPEYLEFHKKHSPGGLRYWRVTDHKGDLGTKLIYDPDKAAERTRVHADHFRSLVEGKLRRHYEETGSPGVLTIPFDAELFGHWWFEGIEWLHALVCALGGNYATIEKASTVLQNVAPSDTIELSEGSWGEGGHHFIWYNDDTTWTWERIRRAEQMMADAIDEAADDAMGSRILKQMARELLLLQSSDWQFLITTGTAGGYGKSRFLGHYEAFEDLRRMSRVYRSAKTLEGSDVDRLRALEEEDALFDDVNVEWFRERTVDGL
ncbi:MAG TPA: 1,4-alpha-glucan branching protein domain-containing protein [Syntrophorhabdales bacterium]|nr:1,4-alpha-glucan branching protein domain-containing protein [Syntrophorhabdales bacterium]